MKRSLFLSVLIAVLFNVIGFAQAQGTESRLAMLEAQQGLYDKFYQEQKGFLAKEMDLEKKRLGLEVESFRSDLKGDYNYLGILVLLFGTLTVGGVVSGFLKLKKYIESTAVKKIEEVTERNRDEFLAMIEKHSEETQLKKEKEIAVVSPVENAFLKKFFSKMGFKRVQFFAPDAVSSRDIRKAALVLFDNQGGKFQQEEILDLCKGTLEDQIIFYFGSGRFDGGEFTPRVSFANAPVQLYGNLVNALRYQELL